MVVDRIDPQVIPSLHELEFSLSTSEVSYQAIIHTAIVPISVLLAVSEELEEGYLPTWPKNSLDSRDCLDMFLTSNEGTMEAMYR